MMQGDNGVSRIDVLFIMSLMQTQILTQTTVSRLFAISLVAFPLLVACPRVSMYYLLLLDILVAFYISTEDIAVWFCSLHFTMKDYLRSAGHYLQAALEKI